MSQEDGAIKSPDVGPGQAAWIPVPALPHLSVCLSFPIYIIASSSCWEGDCQEVCLEVCSKCLTNSRRCYSCVPPSPAPRGGRALEDWFVGGDSGKGDQSLRTEGAGRERRCVWGPEAGWGSSRNRNGGRWPVKSQSPPDSLCLCARGGTDLPSPDRDSGTALNLVWSPRARSCRRSCRGAPENQPSGGERKLKRQKPQFLLTNVYFLRVRVSRCFLCSLGAFLGLPQALFPTPRCRKVPQSPVFSPRTPGSQPLRCTSVRCWP